MSLQVKTQDDKIINISDDIKTTSLLLKNLIEDSEMGSGIIPLPNITSRSFLNIEKFLTEDKEFVKELEKDELFEIVLAANYLNMEVVLDLLCKEVANRIKDMEVKDMKIYLGIEDSEMTETENNCEVSVEQSTVQT